MAAAAQGGGREIDLTQLPIEQLTNYKTQHEQVRTPEGAAARGARHSSSRPRPHPPAAAAAAASRRRLGAPPLGSIFAGPAAVHFYLQIVTSSAHLPNLPAALPAALPALIIGTGRAVA